MLLIFIAFAYGQENDSNVRFIHGGEELKPVGTLLISSTDTVRPSDKASDKFFGKTIKTDTRSLDVLNIFIKRSKFLSKDNSQLKGSNEYFIVKCSSGLKLFLNAKSINSFFSSLRIFLNNEHVDKRLIKAFDYY